MTSVKYVQMYIMQIKNDQCINKGFKKNLNGTFKEVHLFCVQKLPYE